MKKETTVAIILGIVFGLSVAFLAVFKARQVKIQTSKTIAPIETMPSVSPRNNTNGQTDNFSISEPVENAITDLKTVTIKGKVIKDSLVIIESPIQVKAFKATGGSFSIDFQLALGENVINIVMYPKDEKLATREKTLKVYYLDEQ